MNIEPSSNDITGCVAFYLNSLLVKDYSIHTIALKRRHLTLFQAWLASSGIASVSQVNVTVFEQYMAYVRSTVSSKNKTSLATTTIRCRLTSVRVFLKFLTQCEIIVHREVEKYELPSIGLPLPKPILSYDDVLCVLKQIPRTTIKGMRDRAIVECFYASGIRRGELVNLDLLDVDFSQRQLRVVRGKGKKDRYVPFGKTAGKWLVKYLRDARPMLSNLGSGNAFFLNSLGTRFKPCLLSELMSKYIRKANINKSGACHQYRHAAATHMVDNDADIRHVQEFLGHASISTTQLYIHVSKAKLHSIYAKTHPRAE
jgi:integrase/recombinase XerD